MKIQITKNIRSDIPFSNIGTVRAGLVCEAHFNRNGAVSVKTDKGELIGVKLDEFKFLSKEDREEWIRIAYPNIPKVVGGE